MRRVLLLPAVLGYTQIGCYIADIEEDYRGANDNLDVAYAMDACCSSARYAVIGGVWEDSTIGTHHNQFYCLFTKPPTDLAVPLSMCDQPCPGSSLYVGEVDVCGGGCLDCPGYPLYEPECTSSSTVECGKYWSIYACDGSTDPLWPEVDQDSPSTTGTPLTDPVMPQGDWGPPPTCDELPDLTIELYQLIMLARLQVGLPLVPFSKSLSDVAYHHVQSSLLQWELTDDCNGHSWLAQPPAGVTYTPCCYDAGPECMFYKPWEITEGQFPSFGYEISARAEDGWTSMEHVLAGWLASSWQNSVLLNTDPWDQLQWLSIGIHADDSVIHVWFSDIADPIEECIIDVPPLDTDIGPCEGLSSMQASVHDGLNLWRVEHGKGRIPVSGALIKVAEAHIESSIAAPPTEECGKYSWRAPPTTDTEACCFEDDIRCMLDKPIEISGGAFPYQGVEVIVESPEVWSSPEDVLEAFKEQTLAQDVILGREGYEQFLWKSMGVGVGANRASVWVATGLDDNRCELPVPTVNPDTTPLPGTTTSASPVSTNATSATTPTTTSTTHPSTNTTHPSTSTFTPMVTTTTTIVEPTSNHTTTGTHTTTPVSGDATPSGKTTDVWTDATLEDVARIILTDTDLPPVMISCIREEQLHVAHRGFNAYLTLGYARGRCCVADVEAFAVGGKGSDQSAVDTHHSEFACLESIPDSTLDIALCDQTCPGRGLYSGSEICGGGCAGCTAFQEECTSSPVERCGGLWSVYAC